MRTIALLAVLGLAAQARSELVTSVVYRPRGDAVAREPEPETPEITLTAIPDIAKREYNPATEIHIASSLERPLIGTITTPVKETTKDKSTYVAIPTPVTADAGDVAKGDFVVGLSKTAIDQLTSAANKLKAVCGALTKRSSTQTCTLRIMEAAQQTEGEYVGTIRLIGQSVESWEAEQAAGAAAEVVVPAATVFSAPAWAAPAAMGAGASVFAAFVGAIIFNNETPESVNLTPVGKNDKGCKTTTAARCTDTCELYPYAKNYKIEHSSSCSEKCSTVTACSAKGTKKTTTVSQTETYSASNGKDTPDPVPVGSAELLKAQHVFDANDNKDACRLGLFDELSFSKPKCNDATGDKFVSADGAQKAADMYCSDEKNRKGGPDAAKLGFIQWYNSNSPQSFSLEIKYKGEFTYSKATCKQAFLTAINGCSLPGKDNPDNHKFGGSVEHPCGGTFIFSPSPESTETCNKDDVATIPYNVFNLVFPKFCEEVDKHQDSALSWNTRSDGLKIPPRMAMMHRSPFDKRTPPPDIKSYPDHLFGWIFTSSTKNPKPKCDKSCKDSYGALSNGACGHQGTGNNMAASGKIDVGCGTYEYVITPPPSQAKSCKLWNDCPTCPGQGKLDGSQPRCNNGKCECQPSTKCSNDMKICPPCAPGCKNCINNVCGCAMFDGGTCSD